MVAFAAVMLVVAMGLVSSAAEAEAEFDFAGKIQPILAAKCVRCHGPGEAEAGLRLDGLATALAELESGNRAIVPHKPDESALLTRVTAESEFERMPAEGEPLAPEEIAALRAWVEAGAPWPTHWAYEPLTKPMPPEVAAGDFADWPRTPIDRFVLARLREHALKPSPTADSRTLLRRLYYDLVGLPPSYEEMQAFLSDQRADAYERVVDRLLASPRYGERWARHWMDVVHYADSHGFEHDMPRDAWPYRDYLVRAFNDDKPYVRFIEEQVAGDTLYPGDVDALMATGFLATGPWDLSALQAGNADSIDHEIALSMDRDDILSTVMSTFVSSTAHCARCHDHKFDPITQADYYSLQAVFSGIDKATRKYDSDPQVAIRRRELVARRAQVQQMLAAGDAALLTTEVQAQVAQWESASQGQFDSWHVLDPLTYASASGVTLVKQSDGSLLSTGQRPDTDVYTIVADAKLPTITALRLEVLADESLPQGGPGRQENGNLHLNEITLAAAPHPSGGQAQAVELTRPSADFNQADWSIEKSLDGNPETAWGIYPEVGKAHVAVFALNQPLKQEEGVVLTIELKQLHGQGHLIGRPRLSVTATPVEVLERNLLPSSIAAALTLAPDQRDDKQRIELAGYVLGRQIDDQLASLPSQQTVYCGTNQFDAVGGHRPAETPRPVHVLNRGNISEPGAEALPGTLSCVPELPARFEIANIDDEGARRAALARWLADSRNVLTWRASANRIWHYHFGRGLVDTPNDFGRMGSTPTHPELLDWLASTFRDQGGSFKQMHRLIVTSAVYRQASGHDPAAAAVDGDNRYLWRMNRQRLDAESLRDSLLAISGKLDTTMGGPPVRHFVATKVFNMRPEADYTGVDVDDPAQLRRGIYRFIFRTIPDPLMGALDCPDGTQRAPVRTASFTAIQALATMNDRFVVRQSQHIAERASHPSDQLPDQVDHAYELVLFRLPLPAERESATAYAQQYGLANLVRVLVNTNEFMFLD